MERWPHVRGVLASRVDADVAARCRGSPSVGSRYRCWLEAEKHTAKTKAKKCAKTPKAYDAHAAVALAEPITPHKGITRKKPAACDDVTPGVKEVAHTALMGIKPESVWLEHVPGRMTLVLVKADGRAYCTVCVEGNRQQWGGFGKTEADACGTTPLILCAELFRAIEKDKLSRPQAADRRGAIAARMSKDV